jgi:hypothetical protein
LAHKVTVPPVPGSGLVRVEEHRHGDRPGRDLLGGDLLAGFHAEEGVGVVQHPGAVDPQPEPAGEVGVGDDGLLGAGLGHLEVGLDGV